LYGLDPLFFTLDMFTSITKDKAKLRNYRSVLKKLHVRLAAQADHDKLRQYIPTTFDTMMVDFGTRVERKQQLSELEQMQAGLLNDLPD
jgi:hypothetical protein